MTNAASFMPDEIVESDEFDEMLSAIDAVRNDAEDTIGNVFDAALDLNTQFFQAGVKFGALLAAQLFY